MPKTLRMSDNSPPGHFAPDNSPPVSTKHGLRTADYGLGIKHGLGIKRRLRITDWVKNTDSSIKRGPSITDSV